MKQLQNIHMLLIAVHFAYLEREFCVVFANAAFHLYNLLEL